MSAITWEQSADNYRHVSEACSRSRWIPDAEVGNCEHPGCTISFGRFGLPGVSISTKQSSTDTSLTRTSTRSSTWTLEPRTGYFDGNASNGKNSLSPIVDTFTPITAPAITFSPNSIQSNGKSREDWNVSLLSALSIKFNRRHHCRRCGSCFCDTHSSNKANLILTQEDYEEMRKSQGLPIKRSIDSTNDWSRSVHARVCDMCYTLCRKAKHQYESLLCKSKGIDSFTLDPESVIRKILTPTEAAAPTNEETIAIERATREEKLEYIESKIRLYKETQRHHREGIRLLCNDLTVSRIAASAVKSKGKNDGISMSEVLAINPIVITGSASLENAPYFDRVMLRKREQEVAKRAMSLDAFEKRIRSEVLPFLKWDQIDNEADEEEWMSQLPLIIERSKRPIPQANPRPYPVFATSKTRSSTLPTNTMQASSNEQKEQQRRGSNDIGAPEGKDKQMGLARILEHQQLQEEIELQRELEQQRYRQSRASSPVKSRTSKSIRATTRDT